MINAYLKDLNPANRTGHTYGTPSDEFSRGYKAAINHVNQISCIKRADIQKGYFKAEAQEKIEEIQADRSEIKIKLRALLTEQDKLAMGGNPAAAELHRATELKSMQHELMKKAEMMIFLKDLCDN